VVCWRNASTIICAAQLLAAAVERPIRWLGSLAALAEQNLRGVTSAADRARWSNRWRGSRRATVPLRAWGRSQL